MQTVFKERGLYGQVLNLSLQSIWRCTESNRGPSACKADALPTELHPRPNLNQVGPSGIEPPTLRLSVARSSHLSYGPDPNAMVLSKLSRKSAFFTDSRTSPSIFPLKGGDPAAPSDTATLLRLHPLHRFHLSNLRPLRVRPATSGATNSDGVTGGVYKARERIHRSMLICDY